MTSRLARALPGLALATALVLVLLLAKENKALADRQAKLTRRAFEPYAGQYVPTLAMAGIDGAAVTLGARADSVRQLMFVFTTTCPYCRASLPAWREIASVADTLTSHRTQVVGVVLDTGNVRKYQADHQLAFPILRFPTKRDQSIYRVRSVPLVLLLNADGMAIYSRIGVLDSRAAIDSVISALHWQRPVPAQPAPKTGNS